MVSIYPAIGYEERELIGGSTKPLLVTADTGNRLETFVAKVFTKRQMDQYAPLATELYANILASSFDIIVPEPALLLFDDDFIDTLPHNIKLRVQDNKSQYYFATKYHPGYFQYIPASHKKTFDTYDIENIFAFDILIRNIDRRIGKPNLLIKGRNYLAIDHELSLAITKTFEEYYGGMEWQFIKSAQQDRQHIFLKRLHRRKSHIDFDTFIEYLDRANFKNIELASKQLVKLGLPNGEIEYITSYLWEVKQKPQKFAKVCKFLIS